MNVLLAAMVAGLPPIVLNDGHSHPLIGFGTYKVGVVPASASSALAAGAVEAQADTVNPAECVAAALGLGYRFIDCAEFYANEKAVGEGIARSGVPRDEIFLASKVWTSTIAKGPEAVQAQLERTLADLGTNYLDLYCIHWPVPTKHVAAYLQLEKAQAAGQVRSIGVSNYCKEDYLELMAGGAKISPAVNQIEVNPFLFRKETLAFFASVGCTVQSYRALRDGKAFQDSTLVDVAQRLGRTPAQVLGRWCVQHRIVPIVKSVHPGRMAENLAIFDFEIPPDQMDRLDALTTPDAIAKYVELYRKCVTRDTDLPAALARTAITEA